MYRILSGTDPDALVHEAGCTNETLARDVHRGLSFNLKAGSPSTPEETDNG